MFENIKLLNISDDIKKRINSDLDDNAILNIASNYKIVNKNISLFEHFGIKNISDLIVYSYDIFLNDTDYLRNCFSKITDLPFVVREINNDFSYIYNIIV